MKITKEYLEQIIKEEIMNEGDVIKGKFGDRDKLDNMPSWERDRGPKASVTRLPGTKKPPTAKYSDGKPVQEGDLLNLIIRVKEVNGEKVYFAISGGPDDVKAKTDERGRVVLTTKKAHRLSRSEHSPK